MYALFYEHADGQREWIVASDDEHQARLLARMWSQHAPVPVVVVRNEDGDTTRISTFQHGRRTLEN